MTGHTEEDFVMVDMNGSSHVVRDDDVGGQLGAISEYIAGVSGSLRTVSLEIHDNPELSYKETHAHKVLVEFMQKQHGWEVTPSAYGITTAFVAVYESGVKGPAVSFNAEYGKIASLHGSGQ